MSVHVARNYLSSHGSITLWYGFLGAPLAWFFALLFSYPLVPYACWSGNVWTLYALNLVALILTLGAGGTAYRMFADTGAELPGDHATRTDRTRLMAAAGIIFSGLFSLIVIAHLVSTAIMGPCIPVPREPLSPDTYIAPAAVRPLAFVDIANRTC